MVDLRTKVLMCSVVWGFKIVRGRTRLFGDVRLFDDVRFFEDVRLFSLKGESFNVYGSLRM